jgi:hypothetical protein
MGWFAELDLIERVLTVLLSRGLQDGLTLDTTEIGVFDWLLTSNLRLKGCLEVGRVF